MGQTYSVYLKVEFKDKEGAKSALLKKIARAKEEHTDYGLKHFKELGIGTGSIEDLLKIIFGGWDGKLVDGQAGFDASYGWEQVMMDSFTIMAPFLEDGSEIKIYPDSGLDRAIVKDGKADWVS